MRREHRNESLKMLMGFLDHGALETLAQISAVAKNSELTDSEKVQRFNTYSPIIKSRSRWTQQLAELKATLITELSEEDYYLHPIVQIRPHAESSQPDPQGRDVLAKPSAKDLHHAMEHFRLKDGAIDKTAPVDFLTPDDHAAVSPDAGSVSRCTRRCYSVRAEPS